MRGLALAAGLAGLVLALACADVVLRARTAFREGERHFLWHRDPAAKKAHFDEELARRVRALDAAKASGTMSDLEHAQRISLETVRRDEAVAESSLKLAYRWYETAADLFSTPSNPWARRSRERLIEVGGLWNAERAARVR